MEGMHENNAVALVENAVYLFLLSDAVGEPSYVYSEQGTGVLY